MSISEYLAKFNGCLVCWDCKGCKYTEADNEIQFEVSPRKRSSGSVHKKAEERLTTCASNQRSNIIMETIEENDSSID